MLKCLARFAQMFCFDLRWSILGLFSQIAWSCAVSSHRVQYTVRYWSMTFASDVTSNQYILTSLTTWPITWPTVSTTGWMMPHRTRRRFCFVRGATSLFLSILLLPCLANTSSHFKRTVGKSQSQKVQHLANLLHKSYVAKIRVA